MAHNKLIALIAFLVGSTSNSAGVLVGPVEEDIAMQIEVESMSIIGADTPEQKAMIDWSLQRFELAGLELPALVIEFAFQTVEECGGAAARAYLNESPIVVKVCWNNTFILLHELGHVWEALNVPVGKHEPFMAMRSGVVSWASTDVAWEDRGREHAANVIAWGLLENPYPVSRTYPNDPASLVAAFEFLTGTSPLHDGGAGIRVPDRRLFDAEAPPFQPGR